MTTKLNRIAGLLDVTPAQAEQFIREVKIAFPISHNALKSVVEYIK